MNTKTKFLLLSLLLAALISFVPGMARAAENGEISIYPKSTETEKNRSWFVYELSPTTEHSDTFVVSNLGDAPIQVKVYAVDATMTQDGGFALKTFEEPKEDIAAWVTIPESHLTLAAHEEREIPFTLNVPKDADVGEHLGGIVIENLQMKQGTTDNQINVNVVTRVGARIYQTVPGQLIKQLELKSLTGAVHGSNPKVAFEIHNTGNVRLSPSVHLEFTDMFGRQAAELDEANLGTIFRDSSISKVLTVNTKLLPGKYTVHGSFTYGDNQRLPFTTTFFYLPSYLLIVIVGLFVLLLMLTFFIKKILRLMRLSRQVELAAQMSTANRYQNMGHFGQPGKPTANHTFTLSHMNWEQELPKTRKKKKSVPKNRVIVI